MKVLYRVNAAGPALAAIDGGPDWTADNATDPYPDRTSGSIIGGNAIYTTLDPSVPPTTPPAIFNTERWDPASAPEMSWTFPVPAGTPVDVRLYFNNSYPGTDQPGERIFNVVNDGR